MKEIELSEAIDQGLATFGWNARPEGWRWAEFEGVAAYIAPECPPLRGEVFPEEETGKGEKL